MGTVGLGSPSADFRMIIAKAAFRILIGFFGAAAATALTPPFMAFTSAEDTVIPLVMISLVLLGGVLCLFAPSIRRAFGRGFLALSASVFALPISPFLLSGRTASEVVGAAEAGSEGFAAVEAGLAGIAVTGVAAFFGLNVVTILLLISLLLAPWQAPRSHHC